jgi:hypothetical protein
VVDLVVLVDGGEVRFEDDDVGVDGAMGLEGGEDGGFCEGGARGEAQREREKRRECLIVKENKSEASGHGKEVLRIGSLRVWETRRQRSRQSELELCSQREHRHGSLPIALHAWLE